MLNKKFESLSEIIIYFMIENNLQLVESEYFWSNLELFTLHV